MSSAVTAFHRLRDTIGRVCPIPVRPRMVGFLLISGTTFTIDLLLITLLRDLAGFPVWAAFGLGYACAQSLNFLLNKTLNFDAGDRPVGPELVRYVVVVAINYVGVIVGLGVLLVHLGLLDQVARVLVAFVEVVFLYRAMRFVVFRDRGRKRIS
ncbi:GtrA family protein [Actinomycetospora termitidis]|uniref:GtrA family protein n=1 Tax=Actinomycetospora termitidis TaxID=3053470 RepID=A0ABT7MFL0_9PSEU|nr:GtrA family protein [Actinomycetospora sp. Odt1-22]MDL5158757.1 GtrA family protein [Actinomycetospora sp. Odt1-22]